MLSASNSLPPNACPASAVIMAARLAKTPLAIAQGDSRILFANDAFAALLGIDAATLVGWALGALAESPVATVGAGTTIRLQLAVKDGAGFPAALSTAAVNGPDGAPMCMLCSLVDARGEGADAAILRDAELLAQVAHAASELMHESAAAERAGDSAGLSAPASDIARDAVDRAVQTGADDRS